MFQDEQSVTFLEPFHILYNLNNLDVKYKSEKSIKMMAGKKTGIQSCNSDNNKLHKESM